MTRVAVEGSFCTTRESRDSLFPVHFMVGMAHLDNPMWSHQWCSRALEVAGDFQGVCQIFHSDCGGANSPTGSQCFYGWWFTKEWQWDFG